MKKIVVKLKERAYTITIGGTLAGLGKAMATFGLRGKVLLVTNTTVQKLYAKVVSDSLKRAGFAVTVFALSDGEQYKNLQSVSRIYGAALMAGLDRKATIVALGGGVVGDIAGFAAATYLRGIALVQIPTTLLAMVDSSIGGKTGVDLKEGKNLVGAFYQPKLVWIDPSVLKTLSRRQMQNGMAEVIKYGVIADAKLFSFLEKKLSQDFRRTSPTAQWRTGLRAPDLVSIITQCCQIKANVVEKDEYETKGLREMLNFGHTYGHAIEAASGYRILHGEAVAMGMMAAGKIAVKLGRIEICSLARLGVLIQNAGLPVMPASKFSLNKLENIMLRDKKTRDGKLCFVLPNKIGSVTGAIMVAPHILREVLR
jgi:3-dehydroquinate synthase